MSSFLSIKPGENRMAWLTIGVMLFTAAGASFGGTGIEALFFSRFGVDYLPYMFIGLGITSMLMSFVVTAALGKIPRRVLYIYAPLLIAALILAARLALSTGALWLYPALWLGKEVLNSVVGIVIWGIAGSVCDARQAKRLFPLFNASRIFGQVIGGFATGALVSLIGAENLLYVWAGSMALAFILARVLLGAQAISNPVVSRKKQPTLIQEMQKGYQYVRGSSFLIYISFSTILFSILYFSISLPFSRAVTEQFTDENSLASFLGLFNGISTTAAFIASLFFANKLFARIGVMACVLALPVIYVIGFGGMALAPVFSIIVAFRFMQALWMAGIADPAWQAMFNVVPPEKRDQARAFIGGVPEQAGTFIAGGILIIGEQTLQPAQLYFIGLFAALLCVYVIYQARRAYESALVNALRAGRPHLFYSDEQPFGGFHRDIAATQTVTQGLSNSDPNIRLVSAEILAHLSIPESIPALIVGLSDSDAAVRRACLKALTYAQASGSLLDVAASLSDPEPDTRAQAISTLTVLAASSPSLVHYVSPLLKDVDVKVSSRAAVELLKLNNPAISSDSEKSNLANGKNSRPLAFLRNDNAEVLKNARNHLLTTAASNDDQTRISAISVMGEWQSLEAFDFLAEMFKQEGLDNVVKKSILNSMTRIDSIQAFSYLLNCLGDLPLQETAAKLIGEIGGKAVEPVLSKLTQPECADGALSALYHLPKPPVAPMEAFAQTSVENALDYDTLMRGINFELSQKRANPHKQEALILLSDSLHEKAHQHSIRALRAIGLLGDREAMDVAIENLKTHDAAQRANVLEALDSIGAKWRRILTPLTRVWENEGLEKIEPDWEKISADADPLVRQCAVFARQLEEENMDSLTTLSLMDKILFLKKAPLFANLSPSDLKQVADIAEEEEFSNGETIAVQGEQGDQMFVIVSGEVCVYIKKDGADVEVARREPGNYVGEMAIINKEPRNATLITAGHVRAMSIDQKSFEGLLRDRPDVSLNVIRELSKRLKEATEK